MPEVDEFVYFLVGGLVILGILLAVFNLQYIGQPTGFSVGGFGSPVFVGTAEFDNVETLYASFDANNFLETNVYNLGTRQLSSGLLFGSSSAKLNVGEADSTAVSFDVTKTNGYGSLIIKLDDKIAEENRLEEGRYEFSLGPAKQVEIASGSSDWRIWAPALYELENLKITANSYPREKSTYTFELEDKEKIETARIDFTLDSNAGSLLLKLNGDVVYDSALNPMQSIFIDASKLDDLNILTFDAQPDSKFSGLATIVLTRKTLQEKELRADVNLTDAEYSKFRKGTLAFDVVDVFSPGGYSIKITNGNRVLFSEFARLERGYAEFALNRENLQPGLNIIAVKSLDGAAFNAQGLITRL